MAARQPQPEPRPAHGLRQQAAERGRDAPRWPPRGERRGAGEEPQQSGLVPDRQRHRVRHHPGPPQGQAGLGLQPHPAPELCAGRLEEPQRGQLAQLSARRAGPHGGPPLRWRHQPGRDHRRPALHPGRLGLQPQPRRAGAPHAGAHPEVPHHGLLRLQPGLEPVRLPQRPDPQLRADQQGAARGRPPHGPAGHGLEDLERPRRLAPGRRPRAGGRSLARGGHAEHPRGQHRRLAHGRCGQLRLALRRQDPQRRALSAGQLGAGPRLAGRAGPARRTLAGPGWPHRGRLCRHGRQGRLQSRHPALRAGPRRAQPAGAVAQGSAVSPAERGLGAQGQHRPRRALSHRQRALPGRFRQQDRRRDQQQPGSASREGLDHRAQRRMG